MSKEIFEKDYKLTFLNSSNGNVAIKLAATVNSLLNEETKKSFNVKIALPEIQAFKNFKLTNLAKTININGFRPGKVPSSVVWKMHKDSITYEIINDLINDSSRAISNLLNSESIASPKIDLKTSDLEKEIEFDITFETLPQIELKNIEEITVNKPVYEIKEADIKARLNKIMKENKNFVDAEDSYKAKLGDKVVIDFEGKIDNIAFEGGDGKDFSLELGTKSFIDNFEEQLVGHKKGDEVTVKVTFPDNYFKKELAAKQAEFSVKIQGVKQQKPFENEEEFVKFIGLESVEMLHDDIKKILENDCLVKANTDMRKELFDYLDQNNDFPIPQTLLDNEFKSIWNEEISQSKDKEKSEEEREEYQKLANRRVKLGILIAKYATLFKVRVEQEDINNVIQNRINRLPEDFAQYVINFYTKNPEELRKLAGPILEDKTVDVILSKVATKDVHVEVEDLLKEESK